jgi:outer membrane lipoprotein-sorting protein
VSRLLGALKTGPVLKKMAEASSNAQSIEADMQMSIHVRVEDRTVEQEMTGHIRSMRDGKHFVVDMTLKAMFEVKTRMVADGTHQWMEIGLDNVPEIGGKKAPTRVQKYSIAGLQKKNNGKPIQPLEQTEEIRRMFAFTELREERVAGEECYVLEGGLKPDFHKSEDLIQPLSNAKRARLSVVKSTMLMRRSELLDEANNVVMSTELLNVKLGLEFDPKIFTYAPPEGAEVTDMDAAAKDEDGAKK